jgi:hypothetical protein
MKRSKEKPLLGREGLHKRIETEYAVQPALQAAWLCWQREAARLLGEYFRSGNPKHLVAFVVQIIGMRGYVGGPRR